MLIVVARHIEHATEVLQTEAITPIEAQKKKSKLHGHGKSHLRDGLHHTLKQATNGDDFYHAPLGALLKEARFHLRLDFINASVEYYPRECNISGHELASLCACQVHTSHMLWLTNWPGIVQHLVVDNLVVHITKSFMDIVM